MNAAPVAAAPAIRARGLRKSYGEQVVLDGIDLEVPSGTVFALLGPNGAGKTTAIHILTTLIPADAGDVQVAGFDIVREPDHVRHAIALTGQVSAIDAQFTGEENLRQMADLHHLPRAEGRQRVAELLAQFDLVDAATRPALTYSGGMRRRLDLAMTLVKVPRIIFLDEPTTGLDPRSRRVMWDAVRELVARGTTIFLTTQYLEEADRLAHAIAMLDRGKVVAHGTPAQLKRLVRGGIVRLEFRDEGELGRAVAALGGIPDDQGLALEVPSGDRVHDVRSMLDRLAAEAIEVEGLSVRSANLDDVFLSLTGRRDDPDLAAAQAAATTNAPGGAR
jgi:ABC-2 type transport system ATP-binding protein